MKDRTNEELLRQTIANNTITTIEAKAALSHHLEQLERLGAHLEDDICCVLRKVISRAEAEEQLCKY